MSGARCAVSGERGSSAYGPHRLPLTAYRLPLLLAAAAWAGPRAAPQGAVLDQGSFTISHGGAVVGREDFTIRRGSAAEPDGYTIATRALYPPTAPRVTFAPVVELGPDSLPVQMQYDVFGGAQRRIYLQLSPHRVTLRIVHPGGESARELPAAGPEVLVDDSAFAVYALLPLGQRHLEALAARTGDRSAAQVTDRGEEHTTLQGVAHTLRHIVLGVGVHSLDLWYDPQGRLMRVDSPASHLVAERAPGPPGG